MNGRDIFGRPALTLFGCELLVVENCPKDTVVFAEVGPREVRDGCLVQTFDRIATLTLEVNP